MPFAILDGISTHYVKQGSGPYLLMIAPRGFDSTLQSWNYGKWKEMNAMETLSKHFTIVAYDRRESGQSGGRIEPLSWALFARQAKLLIEHLRIERTLVLGVCMGVAVANQFAYLYPEAASGLILAQPVGGHRYRNRFNLFFNRHIAFVRQRGLEAVRARATGKNFMENPEAGPWATILAQDAKFAERFCKQNVEDYLATVEQSRDSMFSSTFVAGPSPDQLLTIDTAATIWPGNDASHSTSGAHQLRELMPRMDYWDQDPSRQNAADMLERILNFQQTLESGGLPPSPTIASSPMPPPIGD